MYFSDKTEAIVLGLKHLKSRLSNSILSLDGITLFTSMTAKNLGVIFEQSYKPLNRFLDWSNHYTGF